MGFVMLLQFAVENFRSFHTEAVLNLVPAKRERIHKDHILRDEEQGRKVQALPLAVFYGANASGKSNLIKAMVFAQDLIVRGTRSDQRIGAVPFRLAAAGSAEAEGSRFEFVLKHEGVVYTYGFVVTGAEVREEWLFAIYEKQESLLFERTTEKTKASIDFGDRLAPTAQERQRLGFVAEGTRPNQLFLTEAIERNVTALRPLMEWFRESLVIIEPDAVYGGLVQRAHSDRDFTDYLAQFLQVADTGIYGIGLKAEKMDLARAFPEMPDEERKAILDDLVKSPTRSILLADGKDFFAIRLNDGGEPQLLSLETWHRASDGREVAFATKDESDGTHRIMHLAPALLELKSGEKVYVVDEFDRSLHPMLCVMYVQAFLRAVREGKSRGQIVLTTHETCLLDLDLLRRDEIWFVEKDKEQSSRFTSLAEFKFKVRSDLKVAKGYLNGRFGAIPFIGDVKRLIGGGY